MVSIVARKLLESVTKIIINIQYKELRIWKGTQREPKGLQMDLT